VEIIGSGSHVAGVRFARAAGGQVTLAADMVFKAIGQKFEADVLAGSGLALEGGRVKADDDGRTGMARLYAGGDCRVGGRDLTVEAVEDGKRAAAAIHLDLTAA
jgi:glutamate synthase (NADPH/NADH) small chain